MKEEFGLLEMGLGRLSLHLLGFHRDVTERKVFFKEEQKDVLQVGL